MCILNQIKMEAKNLDLQLQDLRKDLIKYVHTLNLDNEEQSLVQETFMNAVVSRKKHKMEGYIKGWSDTLQRKALINNYNRIVMNVPAHSAGRNVFMIHTESDQDQGPVVKKIEGNFERLETRLREPVKYYAEGYKYKEIADTTKLKIETVKKRIFIARTQLMLQNS